MFTCPILGFNEAVWQYSRASVIADFRVSSVTGLVSIPNKHCDEDGRSWHTDVLGSAAIALQDKQGFEACQLSRTTSVTTTATTTNAHNKLMCVPESNAQGAHMVGLGGSGHPRDCNRQAALVNQVLEVCELFAPHGVPDVPVSVGSTAVDCVGVSVSSDATTATQPVLRVQPNREGVASCKAVERLLDSAIDQYTLLPRDAGRRPRFICLPGTAGSAIPLVVTPARQLICAMHATVVVLSCFPLSSSISGSAGGLVGVAGVEACELEVGNLNAMISAFVTGSFGLCSMSSVTSTPTTTATTLSGIKVVSSVLASNATTSGSVLRSSASSSIPPRAFPELLPITNAGATLSGTAAGSDEDESSRDNAAVIWVWILIAFVVVSLLAGVIAAVQYNRPSSVELNINNQSSTAASPEAEGQRYRFPSPEGYIDVAGHAPGHTSAGAREVHGGRPQFQVAD